MRGSTKLSKSGVVAVNTNLKISTESTVRRCYDAFSPLFGTVVGGSQVHRDLVDGAEHSAARAYGALQRLPPAYPVIFIIDSDVR